MKTKIFVVAIIFAFAANVYAQLEVNSSGDTYVGKDIFLQKTSGVNLTTINNVPISFKVNGTSLAGYTGYSGKTSVSFGCGASNSGYDNVAVGYRALYSNWGSSPFGDGNTAIGTNALYSNGEGAYNAATGYRALYNNGWGQDNTANGAYALYNNGYGTGNVAVGKYAFYTNSDGHYNTIIGFSAGSNNTYLYNSTAVGYDAKVNADNTIVLGNSSVTHLKVHNTTIYQTSDGRTKKNIRSTVPGLAFIKQLQPVMYNFDLDALDELEKSDDPKINAFNDSLRNARAPEVKAMEAKARADKEKIVYSGFIAQDVEKAARSIGYDFNGVDVPKNGKGAYGLGYAEFVVPLVKAVQELSEQNARLQEQIDELKGSSLRSATTETEATGIADPVVAQCKLYQNAPNPFSENTQIKFYISEKVKLAQLCIYNLQGTQLKQIVVTQRGEGSQWIFGSELSAGIYLYALIADGKEVETKRMILTK